MSNEDIERLRKLKGISRSALQTMKPTRQEKITKTYRVLKTTDDFLRSCYSQGLGRQGEMIDVATTILMALRQTLGDQGFKNLIQDVKNNPNKAWEFFNKIIK